MLITRGAAHHCPADAVAAWGPRRLYGRGGNDLESSSCRRGRGEIVRPRLLSSRLGSAR